MTYLNSREMNLLPTTSPWAFELSAAAFQDGFQHIFAPIIISIPYVARIAQWAFPRVIVANNSGDTFGDETDGFVECQLALRRPPTKKLLSVNKVCAFIFSVRLSIFVVCMFVRLLKSEARRHRGLCLCPGGTYETPTSIFSKHGRLSADVALFTVVLGHCRLYFVTPPKRRCCLPADGPRITHLLTD
jgi:hypothetical protein